MVFIPDPKRLTPKIGPKRPDRTGIGPKRPGFLLKLVILSVSFLTFSWFDSDWSLKYRFASHNIWKQHHDWSMNRTAHVIGLIVHSGKLD